MARGSSGLLSYNDSVGTKVTLPRHGAAATNPLNCGVGSYAHGGRSASRPLTVFDNVALGQTQHMNPGLVFNLLQRRALRRQVDETVAQVHALLQTFSAGMAAKLWQPAGSLSMIDRRRVEVCRALVSNPRLVLLDEPSAGMTHDETRELMDDILLVRSRLSPFTIVIIEHEMGMIQRITQRCAVLNYGKKIAEGSFDDITRDPEVQLAYLGQDAVEGAGA